YTLDKDLAVLCGKKAGEQIGDLIDLHPKLKKSKRATHMIGTEFDHILISPELLHDSDNKSDLSFRSIDRRKDLVLRGKQDKDHYNIFYEIEENERDISDHYPVIATFEIK
ncbi:MAG: endonuclease, partial [Planctomycetaceae bacterium]|nr:endonuclease [Planctomycetaceae bacterium]